MANKPTKAEYEGFKKAIANPMTPQPIKDKLQSVIDKYASEYEGMDEGSKEPKPSKAPRKPRTTKTTSGTKRAGRKPSTTAKPTMSKADSYEKAKADLKAKTGKTEEECEKIINQYRELRAKAQTRKAKEEEASKENKKRLEKLEEKGDLIAGTNEKTADAVIETTTKDVAEKIVKEIEAIEDKAEKDAKAEVAKDKTLKTPKDKKEAVEKKVETKVAEKTKPMIQRIVIDTSALLTSIATTLGKFDKDSQKEFLIKLRSDIDKLLTKYAFGGMTNGAVQVMNIQQSNMSSSSVNPTMFAKGGGVGGVRKLTKAQKEEFYSKGLEYFGFKEGDLIEYEYLGDGNDSFNENEAGQEFLVNVSNEKLEVNAQVNPFSGRRLEYSTKSNWVDIEADEEDELYYDYMEIGENSVKKSERKNFDEEEFVEMGKKIVQEQFNGDTERAYDILVRKEYVKGDGVQIPRKEKFADGGMVGQEIVFNYQGDEKTGVIKEIHNSGDYIVSTEDGRTLLAQRDRDVISLGKMREKAPMMDAPRKRFGFFAEGGNVSDLDYSDILADLEVLLTDSVYELSNDFENKFDADGEEVENQSRDGFIAYTDGGYEVRWFEYLRHYFSSGYSLPTKALEKEKDRQIDLNIEDAKDYFKNEYPEIVEELGEENIDYNSLYEAGYESEAEDLSEVEMDMMDGTIMCEIGAYYYTPNNDRGIDGKHTLRLFGIVNLESPYHRSGNLEDRYDIDITFDSIDELNEKVREGLKEITDWFNGSNYDESTEELRIRRMAKGGLTEHGLKVGDKIEKKLDSEGNVIRVKNKKENAFVELDSGFRMPIYEFSSMAKGGGVRSNSNQVREKVRQHILENVYDYDENEFDNFNDASQHLTSEFKRVADYPNNISRFPNNQKRFRDYLQGIPFNFYFYDDDIEDFLNGLGINPQSKKYSSDQMWDLYSYLIWKEVEPTYNAKKMAKGGGIATNLSIAQTRRIANETAKALGSDFKVTRGSVDVASFDLDFQGEYTEGGSYLVMENGDVVNYGLPERPIYYNYKTKKKFASGGEVGSGKRVAESVELSKREINDFIEYVYQYYEYEGYTKSQVTSAVNKYIQALGTQFFWGGGDSFDREITAQFLYNPNQKGLQNPLMKRGGGVDKLSKEDALKMAQEMGVDFNKEFHAQSYGNELAELAKKVGYRKSPSASGSLGREFFYHLQKMYDKSKMSKSDEVASMLRNRRGK